MDDSFEPHSFGSYLRIPQRAYVNPIIHVFVCFTFNEESRSSKRWKRWLSRIINTRSGEYNHCELAFSFGDNSLVSFRVVYGENITAIQGKSYSEDKWEHFGLTLTEDQRFELYKWCCDRVGRGFNELGLWLNFMPIIGRCISISGNDQKFFCSEFILRGLQSIGDCREYVDYIPHKTTPEQLCRILSNSQRLHLNSPEGIAPDLDLV